MKVNKQVALAVCALLSQSLFAQTYQKVVTLSVGPAWSNPGQMQIINIAPSFPQTYVPTSDSGTLGSGELFLGLQKLLSEGLQGQLGIALAATTGIQLKGDVWQDNNSEFNNFFYNYKISHSHVAIRGKLLKDINTYVQPYISGSLGVGFNHAYHYLSLSKLFEVAEEQPFSSRTPTALTYTLDVGLQKKFNDHWSAGVGYEFANWGETSLGPASGQTSRSGPSLSHVYTNGLLFNLSFVG